MVVILSILSEQLLEHPLSELTAPGAVVILSEQLLAHPLSELTAPGAVVEQQSPEVEQQLALSETAPGVVVLLLLQPANAERTATAASVVRVRIMLGLQLIMCVFRNPAPRSGLE